MFKQRQLWLIYAIVLIDVVASNALGPLIPKFLEDLPAKAVFITGGTAVALGAQLAISPAMGDYSDKRGRRPAVLITTIASLFSTLLLLPVKSWGYLTNRVAEGSTNGMYSVMRSAVTDITDKKDLIKTTGILSFILATGTILGPMVSAILLIFIPAARESPLPVVYFMIGIAALNIVLAFFFRETNQDQEDLEHHELRKKAVNALKIVTLWRKLDEVDKELAGFKSIFILNLAGSLATGYYSYFVAFLTQSKLKLSPLETAYFFLGYGILACLSNFIFFPYFTTRVSKRPTIIGLALLGLVLQVLYAFSEQSATMLYVVAGVDAITVTLLNGLIGGLLSKMINENEGQGEMFGNVQALGGVASFGTAAINTGLSAVASFAPFIWCASCLGALAFLATRLPDAARKVTDAKDG